MTGMTHGCLFVLVAPQLAYLQMREDMGAKEGALIQS